MNKIFQSPVKSFSASIVKNQRSPLISVQEAFANFKNKSSVFIDVRDPSSYSATHIPGAVNVNEIFTYLATSDAEGVEKLKTTFEGVFRKAGLNGSENIITYEECLKTRFGASCRGYYLLNLLGHSNVNILHGGFEAWVKEDYPTTAEVPVVEEGKFIANFNEDIWSGKDDVLSILKKHDAVLLDVRDPDEWLGESSSPYGKDFTPRKGRLEGAVHLLWRDLMVTKDGLTVLKSPEEIRDICYSKGLKEDQNIVIYCFKGARASNTYVALKSAGFNNLKNYFAPWNEWSRDPNLPIEVVKC